MIDEEEYYKYEKEMYHINSGKNISIEQIKKMSLQELTNDIRLINRFQEVVFEVEESDLRSCRSCKSKKIKCVERQIRQTDEATTVFCECTQCGKHWVE